MKNKIYFLLFTAFCLYSTGFSQSVNNLFDFDYAQFGYDTTSNYVEIYYSINQSALTTKQQDSLKFVEGTLKISIRDSTSDSVLVDKQVDA